MPISPNPFGYCTGNNAPTPSLQLQALLKLRNNQHVYQFIKDDIADLTEKYMDIKYPPAGQKKALKDIKAELKRRYPDIFATEESEKRLYFAMRVVFNAHSNRRYWSRQRGTTTPTRRTRRHKQQNQQSQAGTPEFVSKSIQAEPKSDSKHDNLVDNHDQGIPQSISQTLSRSDVMDATLSPSSCTTSYSNQYRAVYDFLEASIPPMTHLMDIFIDFGCINEKFLMAVSSWPFERIKYVLDQFPPGRNGEKMTEMEKFILQNHFKEYFAQLGERKSAL